MTGRISNKRACALLDAGWRADIARNELAAVEAERAATIARLDEKAAEARARVVVAEAALAALRGAT